MKESSFAYSTLTSEESKRFQITAYNYGQFQTLFGIDRAARVQPWEYGSVTVPDGQITARGFLDSLSTPMLHRLVIFMNFVLQRTAFLYREAVTWDPPGSYELSEGKHSNRCQDRVIPI